MKYILFVTAFAGICAIPTVLFAQLVGGPYEIYADTFSFVSGNGSAGGNYDLYDSGGEFFAASSDGGDFVLRGGYRSVERGILRVQVDNTAISYGVLDPGDVVSSPISITVSTDNARGYTLFIRENQDPTSGFNTIADVADALVDGNTEEYGIAVSGVDSMISPGVDIPVISTMQPIAQSPGQVEERVTTVTYKLAIDTDTPPGVYSHTLIHTVSVAP
jgi:hypothetical protein